MITSTLHKRFAVHRINCADEPGFSKSEYSRFKYGDHSIVEKFGNNLFNYFINDDALVSSLAHKDVIIYSSPYDFLPTSSYYLTHYFYKKLNEFVLQNKMKCSIRFGKIHRNQTYSQDYGAMNAEQRFELIKNDTYELLSYPDSDELLIFIDDISITGTHQKIIQLLLEKANLSNHAIYLYYGLLDNSEIPADYENELNYAQVRDLNSLLPIINSEGFKLTTRCIKFLLQSKGKDLLRFISEIHSNKRECLLREIYQGAVQNKYNDMPEYSGNLELLSKEFNYVLIPIDERSQWKFIE